MNLAIPGTILLALLVILLPVFWLKGNLRAVAVVICLLALLLLAVGIYLFSASAWKNISIAFLLIAISLFVIDVLMITKGQLKL